MHKSRIAFLLVTITLSAALAACDDGATTYGARAGPVTPPPTPDAMFDLYGTQAAANLEADYAAQTAVALRETARAADVAVTQQAQATLEARTQWAFEVTQTAVARTAIAEEAQATQTAAVQATETAIACAQATATAQAHTTAQAEARVATQTAQAVEATRTAETRSATATVQAHADALQATRVQATAQTIARLDQRERSTQAFKTYTPWGLLLLGLILAAIVAWQLLPVLVARYRVIRRRADEGEPLVMLEQGPDGTQRIGLPLRSFWHWFDTGEAPPLPPPQLQDRAAARQQLANVVQAALGPGHRPGRGRRKLARGLPAPQPAGAERPAAPGVIQLVSPEKVQPWIEEVEGQLMEEVER